MAESKIKANPMSVYAVNTGITGITATKCGRIVTVNNSSTNPVTANANDTLWTLPSSLIPIQTVDFRDAYNNTRVQIEEGTGKIITKASLSSAYLRFSVTYTSAS